MIYGLYKMLAFVGFVIGAIVGFRVCRSFTWFGTFSGIVGQHIVFALVGGFIGATILAAPIYLPFKEKIQAVEKQKDAEEAEYDEEEDYYDVDGYDEDSDEIEEGDEEVKASMEAENMTEQEQMPDYEEEYIREDDTAYSDGETSMVDDYASQLDRLMSQDASVVLFTENDLAGLSAQELTYLRNSIYARRGYIFDSAELNQFYSQYDWYSPDETVTTEDVTANEKKNAELIRNYQEANGLMYKPQ